MRIKDYTDMVRHLTDSFNIPEARRIIAENPALSREQFAEGQLVQPGPEGVRPGYAGIGGAGRRFSPSSSKFHKMEDGTWKYITDKNEHITGEKKSDVIKKMEKRRQDYLKKLEVQKQVTAKKMAKVKTIYESAGKHLSKVTAGPARNVFYKYAPATGATKEYSKVKYFKNKTDAEDWVNKAVKSTGRITDADFRKLRTDPQYISMDNSDFAKVLNKKAAVNYRGTKWDGHSVGRLTRKLDIPGTGAWSKTLTKKEVLDTLGSTEDGTAKIKAWKKAGSTEEGFKKLYSRASSMKTYRQATAAGYFKTEKFLKKRKSTYEAWAASGKAKIYHLKDLERRGIFPRGDPELDLWKDLYESSQTQEPKKRLTLNTKKPTPVVNKQGNKIIPWRTDDNFKKVKFLDNETGKIITFNNLKEYLGEEKYNKVLQPYKDKYFIKDTEIMYKGQKRKVATLINEGVFGPPKDLPREGYFHVHHPAGKGKDPFFTQLASWDANIAEWRPRTQLMSKIKGAKDFGAKRKVVEEFIENIPEGIQTQPGKKLYGKDLPLSEKLRGAGKEADLLRSKNFRQVVRSLDSIGNDIRKWDTPTLVLYGNKFKCIKKFEGGDIASCLQKKLVKNPEQFAEFSSSLAKSKNAKTAKNSFNLARKLMMVSKFTGWGLVGEAVFAPLIALPMWAQGTPKDEIVDMLTWGAFGQDREEKIHEKLSPLGRAYAKTQELDERAKNLTEQFHASSGARYGREKINHALEELAKEYEQVASIFTPDPITGDYNQELVNKGAQDVDDVTQYFEDIQKKQQKESAAWAAPKTSKVMETIIDKPGKAFIDFTLGPNWKENLPEQQNQFYKKRYPRNPRELGQHLSYDPDIPMFAEGGIMSLKK
jgi:hypothetical protein